MSKLDDSIKDLAGVALRRLDSKEGEVELTLRYAVVNAVLSTPQDATTDEKIKRYKLGVKIWDCGEDMVILTDEEQDLARESLGMAYATVIVGESLRMLGLL